MMRLNKMKRVRKRFKPGKLQSVFLRSRSNRITDVISSSSETDESDGSSDQQKITPSMSKQARYSKIADKNQNSSVSENEISSDYDDDDEMAITDEEVPENFEEVQKGDPDVYESDEEVHRNDQEASENNENFFDSYSYPQWKETSTNTADIKALAEWIMFKSSGISVLEVLNMIAAISIRFSLSDEANQAVLQLIKILAGSEFQLIDVSKYTISKLFHPPANAVLHVFYCESCCIPST
ncbi:uncharacterized protein LOC103576304 isoform X2 [Microplitis demolitor]|uniref:uncharacterized protein LOC103576304 isoform X2 n=1 Tax=Microplitis demolitor TaxID=69319 RepID=UPI0004CC9852|nr:uncharacterized protein LOC103576304 isoform X2 [Microplitis demolitor]